MKNRTRVILFLAGAVAGVEGGRFINAQINPSQTTQGQNPSQTTQGQNPSQATQGQNPSQVTGGQNPSQTTRNARTPRQDLPSLTDEQLTFRVRAAILEAGSFVEGLRVRIVDGKVVLNGVVRSNEAKAAVGARAAEEAGALNVVNELTVR